MQVHTFIADSANEAVERIRTELGPTAVVLSVRKLPRTGLERLVKQEQIEVLAGVDEPAREPLAKSSPTDPLAEIRAEIQELRRELAVRREPRAVPAESPCHNVRNRRAGRLSTLAVRFRQDQAHAHLNARDGPANDAAGQPTGSLHLPRFLRL